LPFREFDANVDFWCFKMATCELKKNWYRRCYLVVYETQIGLFNITYIENFPQVSARLITIQIGCGGQFSLR
jgi:hypothetical protein